MEARGNADLIDANGVHFGVEEFGSTMHFGSQWYNSGWMHAHWRLNSPRGDGWNNGFHEYVMEWAPCKQHIISKLNFFIILLLFLC